MGAGDNAGLSWVPLNLGLVVGLTGGIGCGKSTAAQCFAALGARVIDTDRIAHQLTALGQPALDAICREFGGEVLNVDGTLNRFKLGRIVFSNARAKQKLEAILHPLIQAEVQRLLHTDAGAPYQILVVPLLLETGDYKEMVSRILIIDCEEDMQRERTMARSGLSRDEVEAIINHQITRGERLQSADDVITNTADLQHLRSQVLQHHEKYLVWSRADSA